MENTKTTKTITLTDYQWGILHDVLCDRLDGECGGDIYEEVLVIIQKSTEKTNKNSGSRIVS